VVAGPPQADVPTPTAVERLAAGSSLRVMWENELGGLTFEVDAAPVRRFVKWAPAGSGLDLASEAARLAWAAPFATVPRVLDHGADVSGSWLLTAALEGESAVARRWLGDPARAVAAIGTGLRALHDALPVDRCPFSWSVADRLARVHDPAARERLADAPPLDRLVICHGDACAPNTLVSDDGRWCGHVDFGALGLADRWADIAVATWSTEWNYGPGWEQPLLAAYGIAPDPERTAYYRELWDASPPAGSASAPDGPLRGQ
jgi:kanamycin kinase